VVIAGLDERIVPTGTPIEFRDGYYNQHGITYLVSSRDKRKRKSSCGGLHKLYEKVQSVENLFD